MNDFTVYSTGVCHLSVCTTLEPEEIPRKANDARPTGLDHGWHLSDDKQFVSGHDNPCPCNLFPKTHKHYLLTC